MKKLIIIGANNFQLPLIKKAKMMGLETHVFAWEQGAVGKDYADFFYPISIRDKELILNQSKRIKPDGIISIASDLASITVNFIAHHLQLVGNSIECTEVSTNKYLMRDCLHRNGLPSPKYIKTDKPDICKDYFEKFPLIVKPTDRSGSRGVTKVHNFFELEQAIQRAKKESFLGECIIEEFIEGKEYSVEMISWKGKHTFIQITEKETTGAPYFVETAHHQPADLAQSLIDQIIIILNKALTCLGIEYGASHSEILVTNDNKIYIVEIGARMGGDYIGSHLVELSTGYDFLENIINISLGDYQEIVVKNQYYSGIYYILPKPGKLLFINDLTGDYKEIVLKEIYYKIGDYINQVKESNDRAACYIYKTRDGKFLHKNNILELVTK